MPNISTVSFNETDSDWNMQVRRVGRDQLEVESNRDGTHLKALFIQLLTVDGTVTATTLATAIGTLTLAPEVGFSAADRHRASVDRAQAGKYIIKVQTRDGAGEQAVTRKYESAAFDNIKAAYAGLAEEMAAPLFSAQIAALTP
jgi:hypothetical protein